MILYGVIPRSNRASLFFGEIKFFFRRRQPSLPFFFFCSHLLLRTFGLQGKASTTLFWWGRSNCQKQKKVGVPGTTITIAASNRKSKNENNGEGWGCWASAKRSIGSQPPAKKMVPSALRFEGKNLG